MSYPGHHAPETLAEVREAMETEYKFLVCLALGEMDEARELCPEPLEDDTPGYCTGY